MSDYARVTSPEALVAAIESIRDARRILVAPPDIADELRVGVDLAGLGGLVEVVVSEYCPPGSVYVIARNVVEPDSEVRDV